MKLSRFKKEKRKKPPSLLIEACSCIYKIELNLKWMPCSVSMVTSGNALMKEHNTPKSESSYKIIDLPSIVSYKI
jgi:hypothetical protein